jgi:ABC-type amino acid transport substrate-binding protein
LAAARYGAVMVMAGLWSGLWAAPGFAAAPRTQIPMVYTYDAPETALDNRYVYQWTVLTAALDKTVAKYGPYKIAPSSPMSEKRQVFSLMNNTGDLSVMYRGTTPEFEDKLIAIHIPVDKNLEGYCVFLINRDDAPKFAAVRSLGALKDFTFGLGAGWIDVDILNANGFKVRTGANYDGLFLMLAQRRFDLFLRSAVEVLDEVEVRRTALPQLGIEPDILFYYPMPMYFWFAKTDEGKRLAARAEEGMWMMINDGTFDALFEKFQRAKIDRLNLKRRRIFKIQNPYFEKPTAPYDDQRLWFDPQTQTRR